MVASLFWRLTLALLQFFDERSGKAERWTGRSFNCKIAKDALGIALSGFEKLLDDAVFLSSLEVVFIWLNVDNEQAGTVWGEFVANIVEGIDGSVFPWFKGQYHPLAVYPLLYGVCLACNTSAIRVIHHFHGNRVQWKFQYPPYEGVGLLQMFVGDNHTQGVCTGRSLGAVRSLCCICHRLSCRWTTRGECDGQ